MIASRKQSIEDLIVEILAESPYSEGVILVSLVQKIREGTTKQAVYTALKTLIGNEVVSKVGGEYFLSRVWINRVNKLFQSKKSFSNDAVFELEEGESISYHFPSLLTCDTYWAHVFDLLVEWIPKERPIFVWNPHEWFAIGRKDAELDIFKQFTVKDKHAFYSILGKTALDQSFKREWVSEHVSIGTGSSVVYPLNYFLNIFDDILIEVFIDEELGLRIRTFYELHQSLTPNLIKVFEDLVSQKYKVRMKISRNQKKASLLRKRLAKDFYIPKSLVITPHLTRHSQSPDYPHI